MSEFIEYKKFQDKLDAKDLISLLHKHNILYELEGPIQKFKLIAEPIENYVIIKIQAENFEKVDKLYQSKEDEDFEKNTDHYLYTFQDKDIIDIIVNQSDWTNLEIRIAKKIAKERDLKITLEQVKSSRTEQALEKQPEKPRKTSVIKSGASWFIWIGILSIINLITFLLNQDLRFITGLNINYILIGISMGVNDLLSVDLLYISVFIDLIISFLFIWFGLKSRKHNKRVYLIGLIAYSIDTIISLLVFDWYGLGFHLLALFFIFSGYKALILNLKETKGIEANTR